MAAGDIGKNQLVFLGVYCISPGFVIAILYSMYGCLSPHLSGGNVCRNSNSNCSVVLVRSKHVT